MNLAPFQTVKVASSSNWRISTGVSVAGSGRIGERILGAIDFGSVFGTGFTHWYLRITAQAQITISD